MQNQMDTVKELRKAISTYLFQLFVTNTYAMAVQMKDGKYMTKYLPVSEFIIEEMLNQKGSIGAYQQCYKSDMVKWICFDFDCPEKESPDIEALYKYNVKPLLGILDEYEINYLTEFSGRRGVHVWIVFSHLLKKERAYQILSFFKGKLLEQIHEFKNANLDSFPATDSSKGNKVGKQVKIPLSCHKSGGRSWFFSGEYKEPDMNEEFEFLSEQLCILSNYKTNDYQSVCEKIGLNDDDFLVRFKYRKYEIIHDFSLSIFETIDILSETEVYSHIFQRLTLGHALRTDWLVIMGTFAPLKDGGAFVTDLYSIFPNYDSAKTELNIKKYRDLYYPATFEYLYHIYGLEMEAFIDKDDTGFSYLLKKKGISPVIDNRDILVKKNSEENVFIFDTVNKERKYLLENDEIINITIWNELSSVKTRDLYRLETIIAKLLSEDEYAFGWTPSAYSYKRKESEEKERTLVSLSALDRVLTSHIALILQKRLKSFWNSYSYNVSFGSREDIFYNWYSSWGEYINQIKTFIEVPFMENYEVFVIDLKGFYDHIDFLSVYSILESELGKEENNLLKFLIDYNDILMRTLSNNKRHGVPQGPAYARIIAEMYLDKVLSRILSGYKGNNYHLYRYVDDIIVFVEPNNDGKILYDLLCNKLISYGLPINEEKTQWYGSIKSCNDTQKKEILRKDKFTYDLQDAEFKGFVSLIERNRDIAKFLSNNGFDINSVGLFFNKRVYSEASETFFLRYAKEIMSSSLGRGSAFRRFYEYVFSHSYATEYVLNNGLLYDVPKNGINFGNLLGTLYLFVQEKRLTEKTVGRIQTEYLERIESEKLKEEYRITVNAILKIKYKVEEECYQN